MVWIPPDFQWFIREAWNEAGMLNDLQTKRKLKFLAKLVQDAITAAVIGAAVGEALKNSSNMMTAISTVKKMLDKAQSCRGKTKSSKDIAKALGERTDLLRDLLTLHDPNFKDSDITRTSNLCPATRNGVYVAISAELQPHHSKHL
ncbi:hypothetical protein PPTG_16247 [Phytophthora nicotianae INRA-310]|uniref:Uncharacterized protein n=1 Tax=Phytophthora nicotianae (strain INRA-310) TaxID=761204 RepID=W2PNS5_PHYN3|nr:hypothetical protein PPTG_16247 [Phytophthora nicotianae INRA-310]ETN02643.1 hypothetical protein PPTG_16247 [Phytophthora nicotianae INRA-310]